jgi:hypothetical protein
MKKTYVLSAILDAQHILVYLLMERLFLCARHNGE